MQAFRLAEELSLPVMVCMDGFILTHAYERVDMPTPGAGRRLPAALRAAPGARPGRPGDDRRDGRPRGVHGGQVPGARQADAGARRDPASRGGFAAALRARLGRAGRAATAPRTPRPSSSRSARCSARSRTRRRAPRPGRSIGALGITASGRSRSTRSAPRCAGAKRVVVLEKALRGRARRDRRPTCGWPSRARLRGYDRDRRARRPGDHQASLPRLFADGVADRLEPLHLPRSGLGDRRARAGARAGVRRRPARREHPPRHRRRRGGSHWRDDALPAAQVLPGGHLRGRQPPARPDQRTVQARPDRSNALTSGHRACQGCGEALGARYVLDAAMRATGGQLIAANATGCLEVFSTPYPEILLAAPVDPLAVRQRARGRHRHRRGAARSKGRDDVRVVGQGGDGGTVDIGFACLSGMFERNDDVLFVCYDNEAYMNTGVQRSGATPPAARTATTQAGRRRARQRVRPGQERAADRDGARDPLRRHGDRRRPARPRGEGRAGDGDPRRALPARLVPCPLGWGSASRDTIRLARLAKETGLFPVFEAEHGEVVGVSKIRRQVPVEEYLRRSGATRTCSATTAAHRRDRAAPGDRRPQHRALRAARPRRSLVMDKPFAITLDVGSSLANKTGSWRTERAVYVDRLPPCNDACPAGREHPGLALRGRGGRLRAGLAQAHRGQPVPGRHGPGLLPPLRDLLQPRQLDEAVGINSVERFLGDEAIEQGWTVRRVDAKPPGKRVLIVGAGPSGLSAAYHLRRLGHDGDDPRGRPDGGRDDALRDPQVPPAARRARRRGRSGSSTWA